MERVYIGTSGWSYKSWEKEFYPAEVAATRQFEYYATQFPTVEINLTFYRLPTLNTVKGWRDKAPPGFIYAVKGSRFITHMKKLLNLGGALNRFFRRIQPMRARMGVILWQLPPMLRKDVPRLSGFLKRLPDNFRHAIEFRHDSWLDDEVFSLLRRYDVAHVSVSSLGMPMNLTVTTDLAYIRFHGLVGGAGHDYTQVELEPWAAHIHEQTEQGRKVFAYFNNDANVRAPANAKALMEMVEAPHPAAAL